jgi:translation initiation factor 4B
VSSHNLNFLIDSNYCIRPVDVSAREAEVAERLQKEREHLAKSVMEKTPIGRTSSRTARERESVTILQPPGQKESEPSSPVKAAPATVVRPTLSFASAAGGNRKTEEISPKSPLPSANSVIEEELNTADSPVDKVTVHDGEMSV